MLQHRRCLGRLAKNPYSQATARQEGGLIEQRNQLRTRLKAYELLLPLYIPGLLQYQTDTITASQPPSEHPEDAPLWLPSTLDCDHRLRICMPGLPSIEEKLRTAQCHDTLDSICHILKIKSRMIAFKNKNVRGQREGNRSRMIIDRVHDRARAGAEKYRAARTAKLALAGAGDWEKDLRVLEDGDIRGYQDPNRLQPRQGRRGTIEDDQVEASGWVEGGDSMDASFNLFSEERSKHDGTGESRRTLSWIWLNNANGANPEDANDDILRAEWATSWARAARATEEVLLLREEMRRVLAFLEWKANWWRLQAALQEVGSALSKALDSYAHSQAALQELLAAEFRVLWKNSLEDEQGDASDEDEDEDENDSGNADEEEDEE
jgi:hypothetical protein